MEKKGVRVIDEKNDSGSWAQGSKWKKKRLWVINEKQRLLIVSSRL